MLYTLNYSIMVAFIKIGWFVHHLSAILADVTYNNQALKK